MKNDPDLTEMVCRRFCRFFRPGVKEELSCAGYNFFRDRVGGARLREWLAAVDPARAGTPADRAAAAMTLCGGCEFRAADCDFQAEPQKPEAAPCGGYVLLCHLLAAQVPGIREALDQED
jgi:hypothetical protein